MNIVDIKSLFDNYLKITTDENEIIHIEKKKIYINDSSNYYGECYIVTSDKYKKENMYILRDIYSLEDKRLRYLYEKFTDVKLVNTIEKTESGEEKSITVVECYRKHEQKIGSIGNIARIDSDKINARRKNKNMFGLVLNRNKDNELLAA